MSLQVFIQPLKQLGSLLFYILSQKTHYLKVNLPGNLNAQKNFQVQSLYTGVPFSQKMFIMFTIRKSRFNYVKTF